MHFILLESTLYYAYQCGYGIYSVYFHNQLMTKEDTGVPIILRLKENDGEWWEKEENVKPLKKGPMGKDFEMPSSY